MPVKSHHIGSLSRQTIIDHHFPATGFIKHSHFHTIAERSPSISEYDIDIFNESAFADLIVCNVILDIFYAAVVSHGHIVQGDMIQSRMLHHASRKSEFLIEGTYPYIS